MQEEQMDQEISGGCLCGAVRYSLKKLPERLNVCHCSHCQKSSGSAFSINLIAPEEDVTLSGEMKLYEDFGDSGNILRRYFCPVCGSQMGSHNLTRPGMFVLRAGTLDDTRVLRRISLQIWTQSRQPWVKLESDAPEFPQGPKG